ncbi:hypothetical protein CHS0354_036073 [Potamilus streckersoni]|uniref:Peptidylglycine monooxygenase n=1 Tax=Potamilus streckersoni TaxID=2493646 RepID=A0AAE0TB81_9BIVA|nr:hypothetical protein CHS0354_036073 [Potamilus streckersoni]
MYVMVSRGRKFTRCTLCLLAVCMGTCFAYSQYQLQIPNAETVPHPCKPNYMWKGVGHQRSNGGGERNPFGRAFYAAGKTWTRDLCQADSDGDGLSNGQELGDPGCVWTLGAVPNRTTGLSHPGVCQPLDSPTCANKTDQLGWVNCSYTDFKCDAANKTDTMNTTFRLPVTTVPANATTYICMTFDLPSDKEYHLIAFEPVIDNANVMHHILLVGCQDVTHEVYQPFPCSMSPGYNCSGILGVWSVGLNGMCYDEKAGFRIGQKGFKKAVIQVHWNNPERYSNYTDSSGIIIYYTETLRPYDAGVFVTGQKSLNIPPRQERVAVEGGCPIDCTAAIISGPVYVNAIYNHMHYLGIAMKTSVIDIGGHEKNLADDKVYSYDSPVVHTV